MGEYSESCSNGAVFKNHTSFSESDWIIVLSLVLLWLRGHEVATAVSFYILHLSNEKMKKKYERILCFIMLLFPYLFLCIIYYYIYLLSPNRWSCMLFNPHFHIEVRSFFVCWYLESSKFLILYAPCFSASISDLKQFVALLFLPLHLSWIN